MTTEYRIHCKYHEETEAFGACCSAPGECIYNLSYQLIVDGIKGCNVNGIVDSKDITDEIGRNLSKEDLVAIIKIGIYPLSH